MNKLKSRKFWVTIVVGLLVTLNDALGFGVDPETIKRVVYLAMTYIGVEGGIDALGARGVKVAASAVGSVVMVLVLTCALLFSGCLKVGQMTPDIVGQYAGKTLALYSDVYNLFCDPAAGDYRLAGFCGGDG